MAFKADFHILLLSKSALKQNNIYKDELSNLEKSWKAKLSYLFLDWFTNLVFVGFGFWFFL